MNLMFLITLTVIVFSYQEHMSYQQHLNAFNSCNEYAQKDFKACFNSTDYRDCFKETKFKMKHCLNTGEYDSN
jgi:hypothetical protein